MPQISVVTSVYNCEEYIGETIQSVIDQTYTDWEFILINDNSADKSAEIIKGFSDPRIKFIDNDTNKGQCINLNHGISIANGKYIARLDHDDICKPERFAKQYRFMEENPEVVLLGSLFDVWEGGIIHRRQFADVESREELMFSLMIANRYIPHSSFFIRRETMVGNDIWYDPTYRYAEDYKLLMDLMAIGDVDCIMEELVTYRVFPEQTTATTDSDVIKDERDRPRLDYLKAKGYNDYTMIVKAVNGDIGSLSEIRQLSKEMKSLAAGAGLDVSNNEHSRRVFYDVYNILLAQQKSRYPATIRKSINRIHTVFAGGKG